MRKSTTTKRPPKPDGEELKHCWGRRRRIYKKREKGIWKALVRLGLLRKANVNPSDCFLGRSVHHAVLALVP